MFKTTPDISEHYINARESDSCPLSVLGLLETSLPSSS